MPDEESGHTWAEVLQGEFERLSRGTDAFDKQLLETLQVTAAADSVPWSSTTIPVDESVYGSMRASLGMLGILQSAR